MLTLFGTPKNIDQHVIGRISFSPAKRQDRPATIYVNRNLTKRKVSRYLAMITSATNMKNLGDCIIPTIYNVDGIDKLFNGDVLEMLPNGQINIIYQINSKDNVIFVTSKCNANCIMCPQPTNYGEGSLLELNLKLISLIDKSTEELALSGGEPTIVGDDLFHLILACKHFLPNTSLLLLTNGMKFREYHYTRFFSSIRHPSLTVSISMYGDNSIEHDYIMGSKGAFDSTVLGILNLASFGNQIEIRTVIHKYTYLRLLRLSEFIYRNMTFVKHIAFMGLEPIGRARTNLEALWIEPKEIVHPLEEAIHYLVQRGMRVSIYNIPLCLLPEYLWNYARQSISDWKMSFHSKCLKCAEKENCSSLFNSGVDIYGRYLKPIGQSSP